MELTDIYGRKTDIEKGDIKKRNGFCFFTLEREGRVIGDVYYSDHTTDFILILPGAGYTREKGEKIISKFKFFIRNNLGLILYNYPDYSVFSLSDKDFFNYVQLCVEEIRGITKKMSDEGFSLSIMGMSLGGIIGLITTAVEEKINKSVILISGGDLEVITWKGLLRFKLKKDCPRNACRNMHRVYKKLLKKRMYQEILTLPRKCFLYDPLTYKEFLKDKKILMVNGIFDFIVPPLSAIEMKRDMKNIQLYWVPSTHLTFVFFFPFLKNKILSFLITDK